MGPSEKITSFKQLRTWQHARELTVYVYKVTEQFPVSETYGLRSQIRRSVTSIAANIAEGFSRNGHREKVNFYSIALGSLTETLSHAYISNDLRFIKSEELGIIERRADALHKMLNGLIKKAPGRSQRPT